VAETQEILNAAARLGNLVGEHAGVKAYRELARQLDLDIGARNLLGQFEQLMETLAMKEATGQPIDLNEKQTAQSLQQSIQIHPLLQKLMAAQHEYMELMKTVQETINAGINGQIKATAEMTGAAPASKIILET
jgi:cell fate (sporulation/competence/biofilm development) regulator YlbF (YheA/YmcA/DUF963 family)